MLNINNIDNLIKDFVIQQINKYEENLYSHYITNKKTLHMNLILYNELYLLYTDKISSNLIHTDKTINKLLHILDYCVFNKNGEILAAMMKKNKILQPYNENINKILNNDDWSKIKIYNNYIGDNLILFFNDTDNEYYYIDSYDEIKLLKLKDNPQLHTFITESNIIDFETKNTYEIYIQSNKFKHLLVYENNKIVNNIIKFKEYSKNKLLYTDKQIYYSCQDELLFDLENISSNNEQYKKLTKGGFILEYENQYYTLNTHLYQKILDLLPKYKNINKCYLELYKNDNLSFMINYMTPYAVDIIKRVNTSMRIIAKEILNIYHLTRNKSNSELYNILSMDYKKILFDLHKIFINTRKNEELVDDFLGDKKSISNEIVYKYLKKINFDTLITIYNDRDELMDKIKNDLIDENNTILIMDCINTKTMCYLLKL
jgi:hypothetical protein